MRRTGIPIVALVFVLSPVTVSAQSQADICDGVSMFQPGQWVEFHLTGQPGLESMRISHVGSETIDGTTYHRYEQQVNGQMGTLINQMLTSGRMFEMEGVREMVMQVPGQPPTRITGEMLEMAKQQNRATQDRVIADERCKAAESLGNEAVTVPAGAIEALHIRTADGDEAWISTAVPGAMVKTVTKEGITMVLASHGTGATSVLRQ
jgi:hypothetical protein